ncbi:hypothetical protein AUJ62_02665 [Candidatus Pacearchaeota archaeon CG1_02_32_21]|nr:MAG: hypothetical protein AUJ62_02665 [Candidatus Pacearchaeota archaeon CG1_02_32_21]
MTNYSHSRLSAFEQCKLKYKYHYVDRIKTKVEKTAELVLGSTVHEGLEKLYRLLQMGKVLTLKQVLSFYKSQWKKNWSKSILIVNKELGEKDYKKMGEKFLVDYYHTYAPFNQGKVLGIETQHFLSLDENNKIHVRMDRIVEASPGIYEIHDYKTNKSLPTQAHLDEDRQLALYSIWVRENFKDTKKVKLIWHFLQFNKEMVSERTPEQLVELKKSILSLIKEIEEEKEFAPTVSTLCNWCEFKSICPMWKHQSSIETLPENKYLKEEGVNLVNKYAELTYKKRQLEKEIAGEMELVKDALIKYAESKEVSVVFSKENKISIKQYDSIKVPSKNTKEREKLEKLLKELNRWDDVAGLDTFALKKAVEEGDWPANIINSVKKFMEIEKSYRLSLGKVKGDE